MIFISIMLMMMMMIIVIVITIITITVIKQYWKWFKASCLQFSGFGQVGTHHRVRNSRKK